MMVAKMVTENTEKVNAKREPEGWAFVLDLL